MDGPAPPSPRHHPVDDQETLQTSDTLGGPPETIQRSETLQSPPETIQRSETLQGPPETIQRSETLQSPPETIQSSETLHGPPETIQSSETIQSPPETVQSSETLHGPPDELQGSENLHAVLSPPEAVRDPGSLSAVSPVSRRQAPPHAAGAPCERGGPSEEAKLCGFLEKQAGPLKAWKLRWFTYEDKNNRLFYYRTPQDVAALGHVDLSAATFSYPLQGETGTFHIRTPQRTFNLKAVSQELMLYWLQQLQAKRWRHQRARDSVEETNCNNNNAGNPEDHFLPPMKGLQGLVGEEAAAVSSQRRPLSNVSLKHPIIEIQNSVHNLMKRSSQDWTPSMFYVDAQDANTPPTSLPAPPPLPLADPAGQVTPKESVDCQAHVDVQRKKKTRRSCQQQEHQSLVEEVRAQKELVWLLHKTLEAAQLEKRTCAEFVAAKDEQERLEKLRHYERLVADLRVRLEKTKAEATGAMSSLAEKEAEVAELQEVIRVLSEKNKVPKSMSAVQRRFSSPAGTLDVSRQLQQQIENLKDDIQAYKTQNKFLNSEIFQLTKLWRRSSEQEKSLMVKCAYLEAHNCRAESRYLGILQKLQEDKSLDPVQQRVVRDMIEDALKGELKGAVKTNAIRDHDQYGFKIVPDYEVADMKLLAKIQALEIRSHNLLIQESGEPSSHRWAEYLAGRSDGDLCPSADLKGLLRGGVPPEYRQRVWRWLVRARTASVRDQHPQRYAQLCKQSRTSPHPASRQIQLDLHRTLTSNQTFSSPSSPALQQLRRILLAFSWHNPDIGYCQGLNRLAALGLLVLQNEEEAFWCLVAVVDTILPQDYFTQKLVASQADQWVLKDFLAEKLPRLAAHLEVHAIDVSLITFNWFLAVFVESLPSDILLPLWDAFLYEGCKVIFRYALALFKYKEEEMLKIQDSVEIYQYLRLFTKTICDSRKLIAIAFGDMNPFPSRLLRSRRASHLERLQAELRKLEETQRVFVTEHAEKELDITASDDDI